MNVLTGLSNEGFSVECKLTVYLPCAYMVFSKIILKDRDDYIGKRGEGVRYVEPPFYFLTQ